MNIDMEKIKIENINLNEKLEKKAQEDQGYKNKCNKYL